jgi:uncharacterized protein YutE (UPF0331/DUF86 family)
LVIDREGITARLRRLEDCVAELQRTRPESFEAYVGDRGLRDRCERNLQIAAQRALDIGNHIIAEEVLEPPEDQRDIFRILAGAGILPADFAARITPMAGFRNILVHDYLPIDDAKVYPALTEGLRDLQEFARHIEGWLERRGDG